MTTFLFSFSRHKKVFSTPQTCPVMCQIKVELFKLHSHTPHEHNEMFYLCYPQNSVTCAENIKEKPTSLNTKNEARLFVKRKSVAFLN